MDYYESTPVPSNDSGLSGGGSAFSFNGQIAVAQVRGSQITITPNDQSGTSGGYGPQTINVCVNGALGTMDVLGTAPKAIETP